MKRRAKRQKQTRWARTAHKWKWSPRSAKGESLFMGGNYRYVRPQLFSRRSFSLSSISHRRKKPIKLSRTRPQCESRLWPSAVSHRGWMVNIRAVCVCVCVRLYHRSVTPKPAAGGRKSTASPEISFRPTIPHQSRAPLPLLRAFLPLLASTVAGFIRTQQKF